MKLRVPFFLLLAGLFAFGCYRSDVRTEHIHVPRAQTAECTKHLAQQLKAITGISEVVALEEKNGPGVAVTFNARTMSLRNVEHSIADIGYDVISRIPVEGIDPYVIKADTNAVANLPEGCR